MKIPDNFYNIFQFMTLFIFLVSFFPEDAKALPLKILVFSEGQNEKMTACGVSDATLKYNIEAAIRYNQQLPVSKDEDIYAYLNINALEIDSTNCGIAYSVQFYKHVLDSSLPDGKVRFVTAELCQKGGLMLYYKTAAQSTLSGKLRDYVDECITRILK